MPSKRKDSVFYARGTGGINYNWYARIEIKDGFAIVLQEGRIHEDDAEEVKAFDAVSRRAWYEIIEREGKKRESFTRTATGVRVNGQVYPLEQEAGRWSFPNLPEAPTKSVKAQPPELNEIWVMAYHTHNALGSISHVSNGEKWYPSMDACQEAIDNMKGWIGMGNRESYRPLLLVKG